MSAKRVYGIDLGTTYSCIAHVDEHGKPVVLSNVEGEATTPSVVFFESESSIVVGAAAKEMMKIEPRRCVATVKRAMGDPHWQQTFFGRTFRPQEVSAQILRKLAADAEKITGEKVEEVVITCPAYFGINERAATRQAGELAGLTVRYVIPEPTAAALAYGIEQDEEQVVLVYDLGGGTFDVTLIDVKQGEIAVVCTGGDHQLGGKDWDEALVEHLAQGFAEETGTAAETLMDDTEAYQELLAAAERAKRALTSCESIAEAVRFGGQRAKVEVRRETFDRLTADLLERTLMMTGDEIDRAAAKGYGKIDKLLLVGGSTYMPQVLEAVRQRFDVPVQQFDPNQAVAKGAAIYGFKCHLDEAIKIRIAEMTGVAAEEVDVETADARVVEAAEKQVAADEGLTLPEVQKSRTRVVNVSSKSFGTVAYDRHDRLVVFNLVQKDQKVPARVTQRFSTHDEGQEGVEVDCRESVIAEERVEVEQTKMVGTAELRFGRALPRGSAVEITFSLAEDGTLTVRGHNPDTRTEFTAEYKTDSIMTAEEVATARERNQGLRVA